MEEFSLARILDPVDTGFFFAEHFERKPLVVSRRRPGHFDALLTLRDIDAIVAHQDFRYPDLFLVDAQQPLETKDYTKADDRIDLAQVYALFGRGATLVLNHLNTSHAALGDLCAALEAEFSSPVQANLYLTPPNGHGFKAHFDTHDVLVLQVAGRKRWRLYGTPIVLPLAGQAEEIAEGAQGEPTAELVLETGDALYLPRGVVHDAISGDGTSAHVTLGILSYTWIEALFEALSATALADPAFRRALPPLLARPEFDRSAARETFRGLLERFAATASADGALDVLLEQFIDSRRPRLAGQLAGAPGAALTADTQLVRGASLIYAIREEADAVVIRCYGKEIRLPALARPALQRALRGDRFMVRDLPGLDDEGRLVLARRLFREGILAVA